MDILPKLPLTLNHVIIWSLSRVFKPCENCRDLYERGYIVRINIVIAEHDPQTCQLIANAVKSSQSDFKITDIMNTGTGLLRLLETTSPDIVMLDVLLPGIDVLGIIKNHTDKRFSDIRFVLIGNRDFNTLYQAVKLGITDYLAKPLDALELDSCVSRLSCLSKPVSDSETTHRFYIDDKGILEAFKKQSLSLKEFNRIYGTHFCDGLFQMLLTRFEMPAPTGYAGIFSHDSTQKARINKDIIAYFHDICSDIIIDRKSDSSIILLNYSEEVRADIECRINNKLYLYLTRADDNAELTICASNTISDLYHVWELKEQVRDLEWSRMKKPKSHAVLRPSNQNQFPIETKEWLQQTFINIRIAFETLDIPGFIKLIDELYALPQDILAANEVRIFIKQILALLFDIHSDSISEFSDPIQLQLKIMFSLRCCVTFQSHRNSMVSQCTELMNKIATCIEKQYTPAVMQAIITVKHNLDKKITLESVASTVHLNTSYFSYLFHKEIGQSFTKYVNGQKNKFACELLNTTSLNISEVAYRVGFPSVQTFSKFFKGLNGITPSQYRQLYQNEDQ